MKSWRETALVFDEMARLRKAGRACALATLTRVTGSSYRRPGARLLIRDDGSILGNVSGGCLEEDLRERAKKVIASGQPESIHYDTGEAIELTWRLRSYAQDCEAYLKATVAYDAEIASAWNVYPSALMPERETAELLGLKLAGHPNPKRLFTTDGIPPLLRKSELIRSEEEVKNR